MASLVPSSTTSFKISLLACLQPQGALFEQCRRHPLYIRSGLHVMPH